MELTRSGGMLKLRAAGLKRAKNLVTAAEHSIGSQELVIAQGLN